MADVRISQLSHSLPLSGREYVPITQRGIDGKLHTVYTTPNDIASYVLSKVTHPPSDTSTTPSSIITPVGAMLPFAGVITAANLPTGWLVCDGTAVSKITYSTLYSVIGDKFGSTTDPSLFKLPDVRYRTIVGYNNVTDTAVPEFGNWLGNQSLSLGQTGGEFNHQLTLSEIALHDHLYTGMQQVSTLTTTSYGGLGISNAGYDPNGPQGSGWYAHSTSGWGRTVKLKVTATVPTTQTTFDVVSATSNTSSAGGNGFHNNMQPYICANYIIKYI